jgi:hypothetical protein
MSTTPNQHNFRFPSYADSPDVPRDISLLAKDIADYIDIHPGPQGIQGVRGYSVLSGISDPSSGTGIDGDFYINITSHAIFGPKTSGAWGSGTSLGGNSVLNGIIDPTSSIGSNGDFYINTVSNKIFGPKSSNVWPSGINIVGPAGAKGDTGATGPKGDAAATVSVNPTTITGAPGTSALVENTGTSSNAVFKFTIPRGADGAQGPAGANGTNGVDGTTPTLDPITGKISLSFSPQATLGVNSDWFPTALVTTSSFYLGKNSTDGSPAKYWKGAYLASSTVVTSDQRTKENISSTDLGLNFINSLNPVKYQIIGNESGRWHYGLIAQDVKIAVDNANVEDFGGWVLDNVDDPESSQALRYEEFISPLIKAVQELTARVKALEEK